MNMFFYFRRFPRFCMNIICNDEKTVGFFPDMPCMKRAYRDKKASVHWSAARSK